MEKPSFRYMRLSLVLIGAAFACFIATIIGFSVHAAAIGITFMVLMIVLAAAGFIAAFTFRSQARKWRDERLSG